MKTVITAASLYTPVLSIDLPVVSIEDGCILSIGSRAQTEVPSGAQVFDFPGCILSPGFIDLHIHGGAGYDVMEDNDAALTAVGLSIARHGVTGYLPTTVTASEDKTLRALERLGAAVARRDETDSCARPLGIHLEGPFISHAKRGVHPPQDLIAPSAKMLDRFWNASGGSLRMMTIAPEPIMRLIHLTRCGRWSIATLESWEPSSGIVHLPPTLLSMASMWTPQWSGSSWPRKARIAPS